MIDIKIFKITKAWIVKVKDDEGEGDAVKLIHSDPLKYLDQVTVTRIESKKPEEKAGWVNGIKNQLVGSTHSRR